MNFERVPEHEILRDSVREFFARELPEERIREMDRARRIPRDMWKRFAKLGWSGLSVPTEHGGSGADVSTGAVLCEELARRFPSLATDWLLISMTARVLRESGTAKQKAELLAPPRAGRFPDELRHERARGRHRCPRAQDASFAAGQRMGGARPEALHLLCRRRRRDPRAVPHRCRRDQALARTFARAHAAQPAWRARSGASS
jgi:hypothetical protein